jgi:hypothetical protein
LRGYTRWCNPLFFFDGEYGIRTRDLRLARAALSHLS